MQEIEISIEDLITGFEWGFSLSLTIEIVDPCEDQAISLTVPGAGKELEYWLRDDALIYEVVISSSLPDCQTNVMLITTCGENNELCPEII